MQLETHFAPNCKKHCFFNGFPRFLQVFRGLQRVQMEPRTIQTEPWHVQTEA